MNKTLIAFLTPFLMFLAIAAYGAISDLDKSTIGVTNTLVNPSGEGSTAGYSKSGGTFGTGGTAGAKYFSWDSNAAGQTILSGYQTISSGDPWSGSNGAISARFKCASGTCTHKLQVFDGTNVLAEKTINSSTSSYARTTVNFIYPATGTIAWRLISVAADEPIVYWREGYRGLADGFNLSQVSQAQAIGSIYWPGGSTDWTSAGTSFTGSGTDFGSQSGNPAPTIVGSVTETVRQPFINYANAAPGVYFPQFDFAFYHTAANNSYCRIYEAVSGTEVVKSQVINNSLASTVVKMSLRGTYNITTAQSSLQFKLQCYTATSGTSALAMGASDNGLRASLESFPSQSQTALRTDQTPASWSGYSTVSSGCSTTSASYGDPTSACTGLALSPITTRNITCSSTGTATAGISCNLARTGTHNICATVNWTKTTAGTGSFRLVDGSGTVINAGQSLTLPDGYYGSVQVCGDYNVTSNASAITFKVQPASSGGTVSIVNGIASGSPAITWQVTEKDAPMSAPYFVGSVTSSSSGQLRIESAEINGGTCAVTSQSGPWITASGGSAGACAFTISGFSSTPSCSSTPISSATTVGYSFAFNTKTSTSLVSNNRYYNGTWNVASENYSILCLVPR